jgi:hypothetical protein
MSVINEEQGDFQLAINGSGKYVQSSVEHTFIMLFYVMHLTSHMKSRRKSYIM